MTSIDRTLEGEQADGTASARAFTENKWQLIDRFFREPEEMTCCICGHTLKTREAERLVSEDIYGGGRLVRYRCPDCNAIIGPNKMWALTEEELSEECRLHYLTHTEGETTDAELAVFRLLHPEKGKTYLNYGCGAWSGTIDQLRAEGYDVWGYDPYAPCDSEWIITDPETLRRRTFDGIFSHDLLEHLRYPLETFALMHTLLNEGGVMVHSTACYQYVYEYDRFHLVFYTGNAVNVLAEKTGFEILGRHEDHERLAYSVTFRKKDTHEMEEKR